MKFTLEIEMDNAAFDDGGAADELPRILRELACRVHGMSLDSTMVVRDINGNKVGTAVLDGEDCAPPDDDDDEDEEADDDDEVEEEESDDDDEHGLCPLCGGPVGVLGKLGRLTHFVCRDCGIHTSR